MPSNVYNMSDKEWHFTVFLGIIVCILIILLPVLLAIQLYSTYKLLGWI